MCLQLKIRYNNLSSGLLNMLTSMFMLHTGNKHPTKEACCLQPGKTALYMIFGLLIFLSDLGTFNGTGR
jgi:hypothetical protein